MSNGTESNTGAVDRNFDTGGTVAAGGGIIESHTRLSS